MKGLSAWIHAARPRTLAAAAAPVLIGAALSYRNGVFQPVASAIALTCAFLIQVGTNFANDYYDARKGADTGERLGFKRAVAEGWIPPAAMLRATWLVMGLAFLLGLLLVLQSGWPILLLGIVSILAGVAYTGGPYPLGYNGLGDLFVMLFFGQAAVMGTVYVNGGGWTGEAFLWSLGPGALAVNILVLNNLRDVDTDRKAGKRTLGVLLGDRALLLEYAFMVVLAAVAPLLATGFHHTGLFVVSGLVLAAGGSLFREVSRVTDKRALNPLLERTARLLALYGLALALVLALVP